MSDDRVFYVITGSGRPTGLAGAQFATDPLGNQIVNPNLTFFNSQVAIGVNPNDVFLNENGLTTANYQSSAYQLYSITGQPLAVQNQGSYYVAPIDYSVFDTMNAVQNLSQYLSPLNALRVYNLPVVGEGDLQHNYADPGQNTDFVKSFTDIGNFNLGVSAAKLGISVDDTLREVGRVNTFLNTDARVDHQGDYGSSVRGEANILDGYSRTYNEYMPEQDQQAYTYDQTSVALSNNYNHYSPFNLASVNQNAAKVDLLDPGLLGGATQAFSGANDSAGSMTPNDLVAQEFGNLPANSSGYVAEFGDRPNNVASLGQDSDAALPPGWQLLGPISTPGDGNSPTHVNIFAPQDGFNQINAGGNVYSVPNGSFSDAYNNSYPTQQAADQGQDFIQDVTGDDDDSGEPVILDIAGGGINITQLTSSNTYEDMTGNGYKSLTAWAGAGNGVLFVDPTGQGQLTQANQVIFTDWDPGATTDMQALLDVFDTNHDGSLDSGDADFSKFFVMVSNANGTQTAYSLAQLGITSINLNASATNVSLPDGSSIDGETTFTMTNPTTGVTTTNVAATVTLATDSNGYVVATTDTANSDGSETVANIASNGDGSLAYERILNTSADGLSKTLTNLNNGSVVTTIQTDDTVINGDGSKTETLTNYAGGTIQLDGELTSEGTSGSDKLNSTTTTTSANGKVVTILRDQLGGGWTTQEEIDTTNADGSTSIVVSNLNPDGSASNVTTTDVSADGLTRTVTNSTDGIAADSTVQSDSTTVNGTMRTETVKGTVGTTVTSLVTTVTQTTSNSVTRTTSSDLADGTTLDLTSVAQTTTNADGSTTTTQTDTAANGTLLDETVTQLSASGLIKTTSTDSTGATASNSPVFDTVVSDDTVVNSDSSRTETVTTTSANGTQLSQQVTTRAASGPGRTVTTYGNGDGAITQSETVAVNTSSGAITDTTSNLSANGSLVNQTVTVTSANGLSKTTQVDSTGAVSGGSSVFDHTTTDVTVDNSNGSSTETVTDYGATTSNLIAVTQTTISANGLTTTVDSDFTGAAGVADGNWDQISVDQTVVNSDGSLTEITTDSDGNGHLLDQVVKNTSADRKTTTTTTTQGTSGLVKQVETVATQSNGAVVDSVVNLDENGDVLNATVVTTSADGLTKIVQDDIQGQTATAYAANGLAFDSTTSEVTVINADGSRTKTTNVTSESGSIISTLVTTTSANGLSITTTANPYATAHYAKQKNDVTTLNNDGSRTEVVSDYSYSSALIDQTTTTTSADGLSTTTLNDFNGDGVVDQSSTDVTTINANGSRTEVVTDYTGGTTGTVRDVTVTTSGIIVSGAGLETTITRQSNGSVPTYQTETILPSANGTVTDTVQYYANSGGPLLKTVTSSTSANGLTKVVSTEIGADTTPDFSTSDTTVLNANGSQTETVANTNKPGLISETVTTSTANGLFKTTNVDANGALNGSAPIFNLSTTDDTVLNSGDGSRTETVTNSSANGAVISKVVKTISTDQQTIITDSYLNETGTITDLDQGATTQTQSNGAVVDTVVSYGPTNAMLGTVTTTTSGNGLTKATTYQNAAGSTTDTDTDTTSYDANGDGGTLDDLEDADVVNGSVTLKSSVKRQSTADDQAVTTTIALNGALAAALAASFAVVTNQSIAIADNGVSTNTITDTINGATTANDTASVVTSANGFQTTTSTALGTSTPYIQSTTTVNLDGSKSVTTTDYNPANLSLIEERVVVNTSYDGRTVTTKQQSDYDGTNYNVQTDRSIQNADDSQTVTRIGSGSFGAGAFSTTTTVATNADESQTTTTLNYNASNTLVGQMVSIVSADALVQSLAIDTTGAESAVTLAAAAADLLNGSALPSTLLSSDILGLDAKVLNADGSTAETDKTYFGSLSNLRSQAVTTSSANGLITTQKLDSDGNGTYEQVDVTSRAPDGSSTETMQYYANAGANAGQLTATDTLTTSANGLVSVLSTSTGVTDTTTTFANANGSYQWARTVIGAASGLSNGSASHDIDANSIDTWSWSDGSTGGTSGTITIDQATENQDIATANVIYTTVLGHAMTDAETQYLGQYVTNGVLSRNALATALVNSAEYTGDYDGVPLTPSGFTYQVYEDFLNVLGRLPTASELATFDPSSMQNTTITAQTLAQTAVTIAQYATDWTGGGVSVLAGSGQQLATRFAPPVGAAQNYVIGYGGSGGSGFWAELTNDISFSGATVTIPLDDSADIVGTNDTINDTGSNSTVVLGGTGDSVSATGTGEVVDANANNDAASLNGGVVNVASGEATTITGNNDTITGAKGDTLTEIGTNDTTTASGATVDYQSNNSAETITGNTDTLSLACTGSNVTVSGSSDTIGIGGSGDSVTASSDTINDGSYSATVLYGSGDTLNVAANSHASVSVNGNADSVNATGDTVTLGAASNVTVFGTSDSIMGTNGGDVIGIQGANNTVTASNDIINNAGYCGTVISGSGDTLNVIANSEASVSISGSSDVVNAGGDTTTLGAGSSVTVFGNNNSILGSSAGDPIAIQGGNDSVSATNDVVNDAGYCGTVVTGSGNTLNIITNSEASVSLSGSGDYVNATGDTVTLNAGSTATFIGSSDEIEINGANDDISASGDLILNAGYCGTVLYGSSDTLDVIANSEASVALTGTKDTVNATDDSVTFGAGSTVTVVGNSNSLIATNGNDDIIVDGSSNTIQASSGGDAIEIDGSSDTVDASNDTIVVGSNEVVYADNGSGDTILVEGSGDTIYALHDTISVASGDSTDVYGSDDTGYGSIDYTNPYGSGNTDNGGADPSDPGDPFDGGDGGSSSMGFAGKMSTVRATLGANISTIAQFNLTPDNVSGPPQLEASFSALDQRIADGDESVAFEGGKWNQQTVTWALAPGRDGSSFGSAASQYEAAAQSAFSEWGLATGLHFQEVSNPSQADIQIEPGDLDTQNTGLVGLTNYQISSGQMQSGIRIELENPSLDALVTGADGQISYSATDATLPQVLAHEIGHALGFADNADPNSIMSYYLGSNNRTFDTSDIAGIGELYGQPKNALEGRWNGGDTADAHPEPSNAATSDNALIGRGTADLFPISSSSAGWMHNFAFAGADLIHHDQALFEGSSASGMESGMLAANPSIAPPFAKTSQASMYQAHPQNHIPG